MTQISRSTETPKTFPITLAPAPWEDQSPVPVKKDVPTRITDYLSIARGEVLASTVARSVGITASCAITTLANMARDGLIDSTPVTNGQAARYSVGDQP